MPTRAVDAHVRVRDPRLTPVGTRLQFASDAESREVMQRLGAIVGCGRPGRGRELLRRRRGTTPRVQHPFPDHLREEPAVGRRPCRAHRARPRREQLRLGPLTPFAVVMPLDTVPCASGRAKTTMHVMRTTGPRTRRSTPRLNSHTAATLCVRDTIVELGSTDTPGGKTPASTMTIDTAARSSTRRTPER